MSRRSERAVERIDPGMAPAVDHAAGDDAAAMAVRDREQELGVVPTYGGLLIDAFEVGTCYWICTTTYVHVGRCIGKGIDYVVLGECSIVLQDGDGSAQGRHGVMQRKGKATGMAIEPTGGPARIVRLPIDVIGPNWEWPFTPFEEAS